MTRSLEDIIGPLKAEYISELPHRIEKMRSLLRSRNIEDARNIFHNLKGTGATYGFPEISTLCQVLELICATSDIEKEAKIPYLELGLGLLEEIHQARSQSKALLIEAEAHFAKISEFSKNLKK